MILIPSLFLFLPSKGGQKRCLVSPFHSIVCSSTSHLFISRLRLVHWSTLKIANDLPIFASYYAFVIVSHLIRLLSLTWLSLLYKFTPFFIYFLFLSDEGPMLETLDYTIRIGSTPTFLYFDLYLCSAYTQYTTFIYILSHLSCYSSHHFVKLDFG